MNTSKQLHRAANYVQYLINIGFSEYEAIKAVSEKFKVNIADVLESYLRIYRLNEKKVELFKFDSVKVV